MRQVAAAVIVEDRRLFLARRAPGQDLAGYWELPGGKLESGETPQQALERELAEEFSMSARAGDILASTTYEYEHGCFEMHAVSATRSSEFELTVHDRFTWANSSGLDRLKLAPADVELVRELRLLGAIA
jgi:8-oxo-dGTP diphosphatase